MREKDQKGDDSAKIKTIIEEIKSAAALGNKMSELFK